MTLSASLASLAEEVQEGYQYLRQRQRESTNSIDQAVQQWDAILEAKKGERVHDQEPDDETSTDSEDEIVQKDTGAGPIR